MQKVFIKTYGCSFNMADSENMAGLLKQTRRYSIVDSEDEADIVIINSCTVKNRSESKFWRDTRSMKGKKVILAGCVPQAEADKSKFKGFPIIGTSQICNVVGVVDEAMAGNTVQLLGRSKDPRLNIPKVRKNPIVEIVPINEGCLGSCNFCKTKFARGHLMSYAPDAIIKHVRESLNDGVKELWLTSQDTACYGYDIGTNLPTLLREILKIQKDFRIRVGMGNPDFLPDFLDELIDVYKDQRIFRFIHIPVQTGSDRVLKLMRREYTVDTFRKIVGRFRERLPDITIASDIICGYPEETDDDFEESMELIREIEPDVLNISKFWSRPGTLASKMRQVKSEVIKVRSERMTRLFHEISIERNRRWLGWRGRVIIDEVGKQGTGTLMGRNYAYKQVVIKGPYGIGDEIDVEVTRTSLHYLSARP